MKLRIKGNSIRLRLTQSEVQRLISGEAIQETTRFSLVDEFNYAIELWHLEIFQANFENGKLTVFVPTTEAKKWAETDQVSMEYLQPNDVDGLKILIEKDFACLAERPGEDERDNFPHPQMGSNRC